MLLTFAGAPTFLGQAFSVAAVSSGRKHSATDSLGDVAGVTHVAAQCVGLDSHSAPGQSFLHAVAPNQGEAQLFPCLR